MIGEWAFGSGGGVPRSATPFGGTGDGRTKIRMEFRREAASGGPGVAGEHLNGFHPGAAVGERPMRSSQVTVRARVPIAAGVAMSFMPAGFRGVPALIPPGVRPLKHTPRRVEVKIEDLKFKPADIEVGPGDTVVWTNDDETEHGIKADDGSFNSGRLPAATPTSTSSTRPARSSTTTTCTPGCTAA